jgi:hypothetical protein
MLKFPSFKIPCGVSLVEAVAVASLLIVVTGLMVTTYLVGNRYLNRTHILSRLEQQASQAIYKLSAEFSVTTDSESTINSSNGDRAHVWFLSNRSDFGNFEYNQSNGAQLWQRWVCYYLDPGSSNLYRVSVPLTSTANSSPFTGITPSPSIDMFRAVSQQQRTIAAESVVDLNVTSAGPSLYKIAVTCKLSDLQHKDWTHTLATVVYLRQSD